MHVRLSRLSVSTLHRLSSAFVRQAQRLQKVETAPQPNFQCRSYTNKSYRHGALIKICYRRIRIWWQVFCDRDGSGKRGRDGAAPFCAAGRLVYRASRFCHPSLSWYAGLWKRVNSEHM